jgi:IS5 family transposase
MEHYLVKLANTINWPELEQYFPRPFCEKVGAPAKSVRLMAGLHYLKHLFNLSDEQIVLRWVENPYWPPRIIVF